MRSKKTTKPSTNDLDDLLNELNPEPDAEESKPKGKGKSTTSDEPSPKGSWYTTGKEAEEVSNKNAALQKLRKDKQVNKFYLKADQSGVIVFVGDSMFGVWEHQVKVGDRWETLTCTKEIAPCSLCAKGLRSSYTIYYTVIDTRPYTNKQGETTKFRKVLFPAKGTTVQKRIADERISKKSLNGLAVVMKRYTDKEANCGNIIETKGRVDVAKKFGAEYAKAIDYIKVLAPPTAQELAALGFELTIAGSHDDLELDGI